MAYAWQIERASLVLDESGSPAPLPELTGRTYRNAPSYDESI